METGHGPTHAEVRKGLSLKARNFGSVSVNSWASTNLRSI